MIIIDLAGETQNGFLPQRSTFDNIMYVRRKREYAIEFQKETWIILSDVKSAFDECSRSATLNILSNHGQIGYQFLDLIKDTLTNTKTRIRTNTAESKIFTINNGVPQGSSLSPGLFLINLGFAINEANRHQQTLHREFADDLLNIVMNSDNIIPVLCSNLAALNQIGCRLAPEKTEIYNICPSGETKIFIPNKNFNLPITNNNELANFHNSFIIAENKKSIRYLGDHIGTTKNYISIRIAKANSAFNKLYHKLWHRNNVSYNIKMKIFNACIISILLYGLKCHEATNNQLLRLDSFCFRKLKAILGYSYDAKLSYSQLNTELSAFNIKWIWPSHRIHIQRIKYFTKQLQNSSLIQLLIPKASDKRRLGRPKYRYIDAIIDDLIYLDIFEIQNINYKEICNIFNLKPNERAKNVMYLCTLYKYKIEKIEY